MLSNRNAGHPVDATLSSAHRVHRRHSAQSVVVGLASRAIVKNAVRAWAVQPDLRWPFTSVDRLAGLLPHWPSVTTERVRLDRCTAEWIHPANTRPKRAVLYLHGGAFLTCGLNTHRSLASRLSQKADVGVLNVAYRMLPSHRVTDAVDDCLSGLRWLRRHGYDDANIVVAGDSAGGYLAFTATLAAIHRRMARPAGVATVSPLIDMDPADKLGHRNAGRCSMFTGNALSAFARYLDRSQRCDEGDPAAAVSPADADLSRLPPVTIHASSDELLRPDAELMARRLHAAGTDCELHLWDGQIHDFPLAADVLPEGRRAIGYIAEFIERVTAHRYGDGQAA